MEEGGQLGTIVSQEATNINVGAVENVYQAETINLNLSTDEVSNLTVPNNSTVNISDAEISNLNVTETTVGWFIFP